MAMVCRNFNLSRAVGAEQVGELFAFTMMPTNLFVTFGARNAAERFWQAASRSLGTTA
jgi:hypothetical protein